MKLFASGCAWPLLNFHSGIFGSSCRDAMSLGRTGLERERGRVALPRRAREHDAGILEVPHQRERRHRRRFEPRVAPEQRHVLLEIGVLERRVARRHRLRLAILEPRRDAIERVEVALQRAARIDAIVFRAAPRARQRTFPDVAEVEHVLTVRQQRRARGNTSSCWICGLDQRLSPVECSHASRKWTSHGALKIQYSMPS